MQIERWQAWLGCGAIVFGTLSSIALAVDGRFAKHDDLVEIEGKTDRNSDSNFRLEQLINNTRIQQQERNLPANPPWLEQQQRNLDYRRCLARQAKDPKIRCDK